MVTVENVYEMLHLEYVGFAIPLYQGLFRFIKSKVFVKIVKNLHEINLDEFFIFCYLYSMDFKPGDKVEFEADPGIWVFGHIFQLDLAGKRAVCTFDVPYNGYSTMSRDEYQIKHYRNFPYNVGDLVEIEDSTTKIWHLAKVVGVYLPTRQPDGRLLEGIRATYFNHSQYSGIQMNAWDGHSSYNIRLRASASVPTVQEAQETVQQLIDGRGPITKSIANHNCPKCNDQGEWRSMALVCRNGHGVFAG